MTVYEDHLLIIRFYFPFSLPFLNSLSSLFHLQMHFNEWRLIKVGIVLL